MVLRTDDFSHQRLGVFVAMGPQMNRKRFDNVGTGGGSLKKPRKNALIFRNHYIEPKALRPESAGVRSEQRAKRFISGQPPDGQLQRMIFVENIDTYANRPLFDRRFDRIF